MTRPEAKHEGGEATCTEKAVCQYCETAYGELAKCTNLTPINGKDATCVETGTVEHWICSCGKLYSDDQATTEIDEDDTIVDIDPTNHAGEKWFGLANDPTLEQTHHGVYCDACDEIWDEENPDEPHVAGEDGYCECGNFELCIDFNGGKISTTPPLEGLSQEVWDSLVESMFGGYEATEWCLFGIGFNKITIEDGMFVKDGYKLVGIAYDKDGTQPYNGEDITKPTTLYLIWESTHVCEHHHYEYVNTDGHQSVCSCGKAIGEAEPHSYNHTTRDFECECGAKYTGWSTSYAEDVPYTCYVKNGEVLYGWNEVEGAWYYFNTTSGNRATGLERVPYNTELGHGALAEDLAYNPSFIDAKEAWYYFDENGKYEISKNGIIDGKYVVNGMIPWHPGFVTVEENVYYFCGDVDYGGNKMVTGWYYATRGGESGKYYFGLDGVLVKNHGVAEVEGVLYYFENGKLMQGRGLLKTDKGFIYVRTSGQLAIGKYYISNTANYGGDELGYGNGVFFGADGYALQGIVDGKYYINGRVAYGAGVVEVEEGKYIYVRSNGELVKNTTYWITNVGETGVVAKDYAFDKNGCFVPEFVADQKNGIVEEDGVLYYYENGNIVYGAGLTEIDGDIYYVRSNGQVATGEYWITNTNGLLEAGKYNFGTDGKLITE